MMLDAKLQLRDAEAIAVLDGPSELDLAAPHADLDDARALLVFARDRAAMLRHLGDLSRAAESDKLTWIAYPKGRRLDTDLNRDIIRSIANDNGLDPVRQVSIDDTWSAMRLRRSS